MRRFLWLGKHLIVLMAIMLLFPSLSVAGDDYPYPYKQPLTADPWGFFYRECTSYVAWRMNRDAGTPDWPYSFTNYMQAEHYQYDPDDPNKWGNAEHWANHAKDLGLEVSDVPVPGAIAHWGLYEVGGIYGHVAYVESVNDDGTVNISEYNYSTSHVYGERINIQAPRYIHVNTSPLPEDDWIPPSDGFDFPVSGEYKGRSDWHVLWDFLDEKYNVMGSFYPGEFWNLGSGAADYGAPVYSISNGKVVATANDTDGYDGTSVLILHNYYGIEYWSKYSYLMNVAVQEGDWVMRGQQIGEIGATPNGGPHLHFEIHDQNIGIHEWPSGKTPAQIEAMGYRNPTDATSPCWSYTGCGSYSTQPGFIESHRPDPNDITELMEEYVEAGIIVVEHDNNGDTDVLNEHYIDTRVNFITALVRSLETLAGKTLPDDGDVDFVDVPRDSWFYPFVLKAYNIGLISIREDGKFYPGRPIIRVEALAFTLRAYEYFIEPVTPPDSDAFLDVTPYTYDEWIYDIVQRGYAANLTEGYEIDEGRVFYPAHWVIRMETVAFIDKLIVELEKHGELEGDVDGNGVVEWNDVWIIRSQLRSPVESCPKCDVDGDGNITTLDARTVFGIISG